ncbi:MAG: transketolase [Anaerolineae bacterium]|nr:transketolase [Anaerolineae bacterium]
MAVTDKTLDELCINTIRTLSIDAVQKANSGHPGLPLGAAPMAYVLWTRFLKHNPRNPEWPDRDRFVLSAGHGSMLLYSLLYLTGYRVTLEDLQSFRQWGSVTPGHPEYRETPGVETTTGPLGQGFATAVGMALAEAHLAARFNRPGHPIIEHLTYVLVSDGDLMEGLSHEAASLAGHLGLGKLIALYDNNHVTLSGPASESFSENIPQRFAAYGWHVLEVTDGNDVAAIAAALAEARANTDKPTLISVQTIIGYGSPNKGGTFESHGSPLGEEEVRLTKENLGWPTEPAFYVPEEARQHFRQAIDAGHAAQREWDERLAAYEAAYPELAAQLKQALAGQLPEAWDADIPVFPADSKAIATRSAGGTVLNAIAARVPMLIGGDADLSPSTKTTLKGAGDLSRTDYTGRNIHFGVREHAMGALVNGLALHGGIIKPFTATFMTFSDYQRPAIRLGALMNLPVVYVFTHDSVGVGEDGPTHQPVEHVAALRAIPNVTVFRPADANETAQAWHAAMLSDGPVVFALTRQNVPVLAPDMVGDVSKGAYVLYEAGDGPDVILIGTGSELQFALAAGQQLAAAGVAVRVVSMPSFEAFARQPAAYRESVLPSAVRARVSIEAGVTTCWGKWVGLDGIAIGVDRFGASAPWKTIYEQFGLTTDAVVAAARSLLQD